MSWESEFGPDYDFPSLIDHMINQGIVEDNSWHNDSAPSIVVRDLNKEGYGVRMWVDHPMKGLREIPGGKRFIVQEGELISSPDKEFETDDLEDAIETFFRWGNKYFPRSRKPDLASIIETWRRRR